MDGGLHRVTSATLASTRRSQAKPAVTCARLASLAFDMVLQTFPSVHCVKLVSTKLPSVPWVAKAAQKARHLKTLDET